MTEEKHHGGGWFHFFKERCVLPAVTAFLAYYLLHGKLQPFADLLPEPWADVIAHPLIEGLLNLLLFVAFLTGPFFVKRLAKYTLTWLVLVGVAHYVLQTYAHAGKLSLYVLWCGVVWAAAAILLSRLFQARRREETAGDDEPRSLVPRLLASDENGVPRPTMEDEDPEIFSLAFPEWLALAIYAGLMSVIATVLLGVMLWNGVGLSATKSLVVCLFAGASLAAIHRLAASDPEDGSLAAAILALIQRWVSRGPEDES